MKTKLLVMVATALTTAIPATSAGAELVKSIRTNSVDDVLKQHVQACGGAARLNAIQSEVLTGVMKMGDETYDVRASFKRGEKTLLIISNATQWCVRQGQVAAGKRWRQSSSGVTDRQSPEDVLEFRELALCLSAAAIPELRQHFPAVKSLGMEEENGRRYQALEAQMSTNVALKLRFDATTGLLSKVGTTVLEQYSAEKGIMVPHFILREDNTVLELKRIEFDVPLADELFERPGAPQVMTNALHNPALRLGVDARVELISLIFRLAGHPEYNTAQVISYRQDAEKQFGGFRDHPCVQMAKQLRNSQGISYDACMSLAICLTAADDPQLRIALNPWPDCLDRRWTVESATNFVALLGRFVRDTGFTNFISSHANFFRTTDSRLKLLLDSDAHLEWFESFFGERPSATFTVVPALLNGGSCYGPHFANTNGQEFFCMLGVWKTDEDGLPTFDRRMLSMVVHEFCHSYANGVIDQNRNELKAAGEKLFAGRADQMRAQAYGSGETMLRESLVRACVLRYTRQYDGELAACLGTAEQIALSFGWMGELSQLLGQYETQRHSYPTLAAFSPRLVSFFDDLAKNSP